MPPIMRLLKLGFAFVVGAIAVWFEAVRRTPDAKRRKRLRRQARTRVR